MTNFMLRTPYRLGNFMGMYEWIKKKQLWLLFYNSPRYLVLFTSMLVFAVEAAIMALIQYLPRIGPLQEAILDAVVLMLVVFPVFHFVILKPMESHISDKARIETEKNDLIRELQKASREVQTLQGIIPICAWCKNIRTDEGYWQKVEIYISKHTRADFTHSICPQCVDAIYEDELPLLNETPEVATKLESADRVEQDAKEGGEKDVARE